MNWTKNSWRNFPIKQQPNYINIDELKRVESELSVLPPIVSSQSITDLRKHLADVAEGNAFLLQGGDCAESFAEFNHTNLSSFFRVVLQMTMALMYGGGKPVVKVGRIAGQFAKPRSADTEIIDGIELASYRGDMVNGMDFTEKARVPDPERLKMVYNQSVSTINFLNMLARDGYASLENVQKWNQEFLANSSQKKNFSDLIERIKECINFIEACNLPTNTVEQLRTATFFTSHEALLLGYEEALTRYDEEKNGWFNGSAHMLWIGDRTRALDEAHIEFLRGLENPIGMKVGPSMGVDELIEVIDKLNPKNKAGKLTLISRMGENKVLNLLPPLVRKVKEEGRSVIWSCDPMHCNTIKSPNGYKTRPFNAVLGEVKQFFDVHKAEGTYAGGVHFEMTGQDVTECLGGAQAISELDLRDRYHTQCDPRLNASQSIELAFLIAKELRG